MNFADQVGKTIEIEVDGVKRNGQIVEYIPGIPEYWEVRYVVRHGKGQYIKLACHQVNRGIQ